MILKSIIGIITEMRICIEFLELKLHLSLKIKGKKVNKRISLIHKIQNLGTKTQHTELTV